MGETAAGEEGGNEEGPGGVAAGEGPVVYGYGDVHVRGVVRRARAAEDELGEADEGEVEHQASDKADEERGDPGGGGGGGDQEQGDGDGEPDAAVAGDLECLEEEARHREEEGVEAEGNGRIQIPHAAQESGLRQSLRRVGVSRRRGGCGSHARRQRRGPAEMSFGSSADAFVCLARQIGMT